MGYGSLKSMEIAIPTAVSEFDTSLLRAWFEVWIKLANDFRQWEREELIEKAPSSETLATHKKTAATLIRSAHHMQSLMEEPENPIREFLPAVQGKLLQLQDSWDMIHNPMPDEEADRLLAEIFPDEPRARGAA
jgi:hypothetical protein